MGTIPFPPLSKLAKASCKVQFVSRESTTPEKGRHVSLRNRDICAPGTRLELIREPQGPSRQQVSVKGTLNKIISSLGLIF